MLTCVSIGTVATLGFHLLVEESSLEEINLLQNGVKMTENNSKPEEAKSDKTLVWWLKLPMLYLVAGVYMATRLFINLSQAYIPFYLQDSLQLVGAGEGAGVGAGAGYVSLTQEDCVGCVGARRGPGASWPREVGEKTRPDGGQAPRSW